MTKNQLRDIIAGSPWRFAKTMPQIPHWYTLRKQAPSDENFVAFVELIRSHGYDDTHYSRTYRYLDVDGWQYWTMGTRTESTILINRAELHRAERAIQENPAPFVVSIPVEQIYCPITKELVPEERRSGCDL